MSNNPATPGLLSVLIESSEGPALVFQQTLAQFEDIRYSIEDNRDYVRIFESETGTHTLLKVSSIIGMSFTPTDPDGLPEEDC